MSITLEEVERKIAANSGRDEVRVRVPVSWKHGICLPDEDGVQVEEAVFKILTFEDHDAIEKIASYTTSFTGPWGAEYETQALDRDEYRRLLIRRCLRGWSLPVDIKLMGDWISRESWDRIGRLPAPLLESFVFGFQESFDIDDKEEKDIDKQSALLFGATSRGVTAPCEAVSMYCVRASFWDKFGTKREELHGLPYREYLRLKIMSAKEIEANKQQRSSSKKSNTRIAGPGGTRASRSSSSRG